MKKEQPVHMANFFTDKQYFALYNKLMLSKLIKPSLDTMQEFIELVNRHVQLMIDTKQTVTLESVEMMWEQVAIQIENEFWSKREKTPTNS